MRRFYAITALVCTIAFAGASPAYAQQAVLAEKEGNAVTEKYQRSMKKMNDKMKAEPKTGNPDHDFIVMMIEHHRGAIAMGEILVKEGKNEELREFTQKTIAKQREDIARLEELLAKVKASQNASSLADQKDE